MFLFTFPDGRTYQTTIRASNMKHYHAHEIFD